MYRIVISQKPPSMSSDRVEFEGGYEQAVATAHWIWSALDYPGSVYVFSGSDTYWLHRVDYDGATLDRNTIGGVPKYGRVKH